jgi:antitoxin component of RelBE/YafQ-DinJ toxin-antitoxin module
LEVFSMKIINFRVDDAEHELMHAIAAAAGMGLSAYIRQHFRTVAVEKGLMSDPLDVLRAAHEKATAPPAAQPKPKRPVPMMVYKGETVIDGNTWRDEVLARSERGESVKDIAESYASALSTPEYIKGLIKRGKEEREAHAAWNDATKVYTAMHAQPPAQPTARPTYPEELVYDPVDPDNPTEEEQAINAEIARRRMVAIGLMSEDERP